MDALDIQDTRGNSLLRLPGMSRMSSVNKVYIIQYIIKDYNIFILSGYKGKLIINIEFILKYHN